MEEEEQVKNHKQLKVDSNKSGGEGGAGSGTGENQQMFASMSDLNFVAAAASSVTSAGGLSNNQSASKIQE